MNGLDQPWVYIVLIGLLFIVYAAIVPRTRAAKGAKAPTLHEIEETMDHFAAELEEQNQALIRQMAETKRDYDVQTAKLGSRLDMLEKQLAQSSQEIARLGVAYEQLLQTSAQRPAGREAAPDAPPAPPHSAMAEAAAAQEEQTQEQAAIPMTMRERYAELFVLYDQGKSTDVIAKKMNMNKGEVNLIVQLSKQEDRLNDQQ